jgi:hypothetical protein
MKVYHSGHPHPLVFRSLIREKEVLRLVMYCETCNKNIILTAPVKEENGR